MSQDFAPRGRRVPVLAVATALLVAHPASGPEAGERDYDMSTATCGEVLDNDPEDSDLYFAWVVGYLAGKGQNTEVRGGPFERLMKRMRRHCQDHPDAVIMNLVGEFLAKP